ncbi:hypothetical protein [Dyadobacter luticola]|uniref:Uncharacterized protein n=1 Tax=Dyadobacter luticola TaxID=1979387 RepID=A0A5R9KW46_9BACT|nr:hypothetical protein [Dyadobacter luticola]TLV00483.1 hypothetical protein FEN17_13425 [Dyadobacter luticola]
MRKLYNDFYIKKKRGFSENELREVITEVAGNPLEELFSYIYTTAEPDYKKYFGYAGLDIDTEPKEVSEAKDGVTITRMEKAFSIKPFENADALQKAVFEGWSRGEK